MKKKEANSKMMTKSKVIMVPSKKSIIKPKSKNKQEKPQQSLFILVGDSFYVASSKSERKTYNQFEKRVKVNKTNNHKLPSRSNHQQNESLNLQEYVKSLSKAQKQKLLMDLSKEMEGEKCDEAVEVQEKDDKLQRLNSKLESIRLQLMARWQEQINQINHLFENQQISLQDKNEKIVLIEKIRNSKLTMIDYTRVLFQKILKEEGELQLNKQQHIQHIINSLHSNSSLDSISEQINSIESSRQTQLRPQVTIKEDQRREIYPTEEKRNNEEQTKKLRKEVKEENKERSKKAEIFEKEKQGESQECPLIEKEGIQIQLESKQNEQNRGTEKIKIEDCEKTGEIIPKSPFKLDIRLDEVQFGKDHYDEQPAEANQDHSISPTKSPLDIKLQFSRQHDDSNKRIIRKGDDQFLCGQSDKIKIPILMTRDKLEQIQIQKVGQQIQALNLAIRNKSQFQYCQVIPENQEHFTTIIDINQFVISFYEFVVNNYMREVIEWMNIPYGKSCPDKLFSIRKEGYVPNNDFGNALHQDFLDMYHAEINQSVRTISDYQKAHNLVIFDAFNSGLNVYRAYYELEGEVFPWNTSERGLTFYQISEQNIEEVFEKTKMKILESCTILCGLMPDCELTTEEAKQLLTKKRQQTYERVLRAEINEKFLEWNIQILNFQALVRIILAEDIYQRELALLMDDLHKLGVI